MALLPTSITFEPGDPLPSTKFNGLVGASVELSEAFSAEHRADGRHIGLRFECAIASVRWDTSTSPSAWRPYGEQRGLQGLVRDGSQPPNAYDPIFTITDPELAAWPKDRIGVLAYDSASLAYFVWQINGNDIQIPEPRRIAPSTSEPNVLTVIVFGLR